MGKKIAFIEPEVLFHLHSGKFEVVANALPEDAVLVGSGWMAEAGDFYLVIESEEYPDTFPGERLPHLDPPIIERIDSLPGE
jgi:hypothetical protein